MVTTELLIVSAFKVLVFCPSTTRHKTYIEATLNSVREFILFGCLFIVQFAILVISFFIYHSDLVSLFIDAAI